MHLQLTLVCLLDSCVPITETKNENFALQGVSILKLLGLFFARSTIIFVIYEFGRFCIKVNRQEKIILNDQIALPFPASYLSTTL